MQKAREAKTNKFGIQSLANIILKFKEKT